MIHNKSTTQLKAYTAIVFVSLFWGSTWVVSRYGALQLPAFQLAGMRQVIAGSLFIIFYMVRKIPLPTKNEFKYIAILAFLNFTLSNGLSTWGVQYIHAGLAAVIGAIFPIWVVMFSYFIEKNKIEYPTLIGIIAGFSGVCIMFMDSIPNLSQPGYVAGLCLSVIATWAWALGTLLTKKRAKSFNPYQSLGWQMALSGTLLLIFSYLLGDFTPWEKINPIAWGTILYLVLFGSILGFVAYLYALQHLPTSKVSVYAYINPIVAIMLGWLFMNETVGIEMGLGVAVTLGGVYLVYNQSRE